MKDVKHESYRQWDGNSFCIENKWYRMKHWLWIVIGLLFLLIAVGQFYAGQMLWGYGFVLVSVGHFARAGWELTKN